METLLMKGKPVADAYRETIIARVARALERGRKVTLAIIVVGDDPASHVYKDRLMKLAESMGIYVKEILYPADVKQEDLLRDIARMNHNRYITGVLPMMPMPAPLSSDAVGTAVTASKDVDCLNVKNVGDMYLGYGTMSPCTPRACMATLEHYGIELEGKHAVVIGRSNVVGKPVANLLLNKNATVTICHSKTKNLAEITRTADIIVAAVGKPCFVTPDMIKEGAVIVDVGINAVDGKLVGDVDPAVVGKAGAYTPVPGGIGVVSNMMVMDLLTRKE